MNRYHISVFCSAEDDAWIADAPDLPGCSAFGDTAEHAVREVQVAQELWLDTASAHGQPAPEPRYRPAGGFS